MELHIELQKGFPGSQSPLTLQATTQETFSPEDMRLFSLPIKKLDAWSKRSAATVIMYCRKRNDKYLLAHWTVSIEYDPIKAL